MNLPKYKINDVVSFKLQGKIYTGKVYIIDTNGTFEQHEEPSYDIMIDIQNSEKCLVKHIRESFLINNKNNK